MDESYCKVVADPIILSPQVAGLLSHHSQESSSGGGLTIHTVPSRVAIYAREHSKKGGILGITPVKPPSEPMKATTS